MTPRLADVAVGRSAATALSGVSVLAGGWLVVHSLELSVAFFGEQPENSTLGGWLFLAGIATLLIGSIAAPRLAHANRPWVRTALTAPAAFVAGCVCIAIGNSTFEPWLGNGWLFVMMCAVIAVVAPPRSIEWAGGFIIGCVIAIGLHHVPWLASALLALAALVTAVAIGDHREAARR
jgi:hypothetical protein